MPREYEAPSRTFSAAIYGPAKTGKSYLALTFPNPKVVVETDPLSFDRAFRAYLEKNPGTTVAVMDEEEAVSVLDYDVFLYRYPLTLENQANGTAQTRYNSIAQRILDWMSLKMEDGSSFIKTVILDTGDIFWDNLGAQRLERAKQDGASSNPPRQRNNLIPVEYRPCNSAMTTFYRYAKQQGIHFVTTHGVYPEREIDFDTKELIVRSKQEQCRGWKQTPQKADMMFLTKIRESMIPGEEGLTFETEITSTAESPEKTHGVVVAMPTFGKIRGML